MSNAIRVTFDGDKRMKKNLESVARDFPLAARRGVREWAREFLGQIIPGVPVKSGKLAGSGRIRTSIKNYNAKGERAARAENISASIVFGGPDVLYARKVHELNPKHPEKEKFLERPLLQKVPTAGAEIAKKVALKKAALK